MSLQYSNDFLKQASGFLLIRKKPSYTSHQVVNGVRRLFDTRKVGHGGTLDPLAEGLLIVGVRKATKYLSCLLNETKEYESICQIGLSTDSQDISGHPLQAQPITTHITLDNVQSALKKLTGEIQQIPPMFSAKKFKGQQLYKYARKGIQVEREPKKVTIFNLEVLQFNNPFISLSIKCSKGTYVRTLCHDLGNLLKTGACMNYLVRHQVGKFSLKQAYTIDQLSQMNLQERVNCLVPVSTIRNLYEKN